MKLLNILKEYLNENRLDKRNEKQYQNCLTSDLIRMELIDMFFQNVNENPNYNLNDPDYFQLIDDWDGYDDQVYIQNNLKNNEFIFWEGWVDSCWDALYIKPQYEGLNKIDAIEKVITERFPRIGEEFGYIIKDYNYFKYKGKFIMNVIFLKKTNYE